MALEATFVGQTVSSEMVEASPRDVEWQSNRDNYVEHKQNGTGTEGWRRAAKARDAEGRQEAIPGCTLETTDGRC